MTTPIAIVVVISGSGSNLQSIIDHISAGQVAAKIRAVISNKADVYGLERAEAERIPTDVIEHTQFQEREDFDRELRASIDHYSPDLVVLAGFMRHLGSAFVQHYAGRLINIHPSLLPAFPGLHTHARAIDDGVKEHGASIHFVTEELDGGPVIIQSVVPVKPDDDEESLAKRVLEEEHIIYPMVISWFAERRLKLEDNTILLDGFPIDSPVIRRDTAITYPISYQQALLTAPEQTETTMQENTKSTEE